jgi:hypothetical protein
LLARSTAPTPAVCVPDPIRAAAIRIGASVTASVLSMLSSRLQIERRPQAAVHVERH